MRLAIRLKFAWYMAWSEDVTTVIYFKGIWSTQFEGKWLLD